MLDRLLSALAAGGVHTPAQLAGQLEVSEELVGHMLADLSRLGYLRPLPHLACQPGPGGHAVPCGHSAPSGELTPCANCPLTGTCAGSGSGAQVWALTDKAFRRA